MLARDLIYTAFNGFPKAEIVPVKSENLFLPDRIEHPIRQLHFTPEKTTVHPVLPPDGGGVNQPKSINLLLVATDNVGSDPRSFEAVQCIEKGLILTAACSPVGENQQFPRVDPDPRRNLFSLLQLRHNLADAVDQNILVVDRGETFDARRYFKPILTARITDRGGQSDEEQTTGRNYARDRLKSILDRDAAQGPQAGVHKLDGHSELEQGGESGGSRGSAYRQGRDRAGEAEREERKPSVKERLEEVLNKPRGKLEIEDAREVESEKEVEKDREIDRDVDRDRGLSH